MKLAESGGSPQNAEPLRQKVHTFRRLSRYLPLRERPRRRKNSTISLARGFTPFIVSNSAIARANASGLRR